MPQKWKFENLQKVEFDVKNMQRYCSRVGRICFYVGKINLGLKRGPEKPREAKIHVQSLCSWFVGVIWGKICVRRLAQTLSLPPPTPDLIDKKSEYFNQSQDFLIHW